MLNFLALVGGESGPQFALPWVFWICFIVWLVLGWMWRARPNYYWPSHYAIAFFLFLLGWGVFGLPGITGR